jgi:hypothetical protein
MINNKDIIKKLPETIKKNGFIYILMTRTRKKALYKQTYNDAQIGYEVFLIRVRGRQFSPILDHTLEPKERFPGNEDFGFIAWSIQNYQDAMDKYNAL